MPISMYNFFNFSSGSLKVHFRLRVNAGRISIEKIKGMIKGAITIGRFGNLSTLPERNPIFNQTSKHDNVY